MSKNIITKQTYSQFVNSNENLEKHANCRRVSHNESNDTNFYETESYEEAIKYARHGWEVGIKKLEQKKETLGGAGDFVVQAVAGGRPNVVASIQGLPKGMYRKKGKTAFGLERLTIYVPLAYNGGTSAKSVVDYCRNMTDYVNKAQTNHTVKIVGVFASRQNNGYNLISFITLKDYDQKLVLNNLAFGFHPSFFRRLYFKVIESFEHWASGHGSKLSHSDTVDVIKAEHKSFDKAIFVNGADWKYGKIEDIATEIIRK